MPPKQLSSGIVYALYQLSPEAVHVPGEVLRKFRESKGGGQYGIPKLWPRMHHLHRIAAPSFACAFGSSPRDVQARQACVSFCTNQAGYAVHPDPQRLFPSVTHSSAKKDKGSVRHFMRRPEPLSCEL